MPAGEYTLMVMAGQQMNVTVPGGEVEFVPGIVNALRITVDDASGDLARAGFENGDLIIGQGGEEFSESPNAGVLGTLISSKSAEFHFLVLRGEERLEIHIKGSDVGGWRTIGGRLTPASH